MTTDGASSFWVALLGGHLEVLEILIQRGADLTGTDPAGNPPLMLAVEQKNQQLVTMLLKGGADPNTPNRKGVRPFLAAAATGQTSLLDPLLEYGAQVDVVNHEGATALMIATANGHADTVARLIQAGSKMDLQSDQGLTALDIAEQRGKKELLTILLKSMPDHLVHGVALGSSEVVQAQLNQGANPNTKDSEGWPVLLLAAAKGDENVITLLLEAKADINATNPEGATALMAATLGNHEDVVKKLINAGADVATKNQAGATARDMAKRKGLATLLSLFPVQRQQLITGRDGGPMVLIPAGKFIMGSDDGEDDEKPAHEVYLDAFFIDQYPVTVSKFSSFRQESGWTGPRYLWRRQKSTNNLLRET